jgi:thiol:disulfide interchange protein
MTFTIKEFSLLTFVVFLLYTFFETKVYLALWAAVFNLLKMMLQLFSLSAANQKIVISVYVVGLLVGYLYVLRDVLSGKEKPNNERLKNLSSDKVKQRRMGIAILLLLIINFAAFFVFN